ncbi:MAG: hypothetical protein J3R72DRAFT_477448 [Linnemannia gamsii]|nr:MAG: hypothetical protein J3R72DRAFT_477448 [Linnemannia gamsii]
MNTQEAVNWMISKDILNGSCDKTLLELESSLILRLAEMDVDTAKDSQAEDDQTKDTADDSLEVEGVEEFEGVEDGGAGHDEALSSGEYTASADSTDAYGFPENQRLVMVKKNGLRCLSFYVRVAFFDDWLKRHSNCIGAKFTFRDNPRVYSINIKENSTQAKKDRAGQVVSRYSCHRKSMKYQNKDQVKGGKTNKSRVRVPSIKCKCRSYINATFRPKSTSDAQPPARNRGEHWVHAEIGGHQAEDQGHIMRGMSITAIMDQLTMDHAKFARFLEGKETMALSRDSFITYDDVYNILHAITAKEVRKSDDDTISARLWMEELDKNNYFTFYDKVNGLYHGFSSPWQLDQLRQWDDVFCFDGTHHARGRDTYLFSIVVKNKETGLGVPVAFLLTKTQQWELLKEWLCKLKEKMDQLCTMPYFPTIVITDQGQNEINAIQNAFHFKPPRILGA